jgi:subtilisin family serine protease
VKVVASPSWYDDYVLTVGSVSPEGHPSGFSLAGPWVDVAAPGEAVVSLDPTGGSDRDSARFRGTRADFGDQLCRTGGHRRCRVDPVARACAHREAGDATHRGHRPPPGGGVGCRGRTRCGRRAGRCERRRPRRITVNADGDAVRPIPLGGSAVRSTFPPGRVRRCRSMRGGRRGGVDVRRPATTAATTRHERLMPPRC